MSLIAASSPVENESLRQTYRRAVHKVFYWRHTLEPKEEIALRSVKIAEKVAQTPIVGTIAGRLLKAIPATFLTQCWDHARHNLTPLEKFDHPPQPSPHWQDILFGEGRDQKLLRRLQHAPLWRKPSEVSLDVQKSLLADSDGGSQIPSIQLEIINYGLNDKKLIQAVEAFDASKTDQTYEHAIYREISKQTEMGLHFYYYTIKAVHDWLKYDIAPTVPAVDRGLAQLSDMPPFKTLLENLQYGYQKDNHISAAPKMGQPT